MASRARWTYLLALGLGTASCSGIFVGQYSIENGFVFLWMAAALLLSLAQATMLRILSGHFPDASRNHHYVKATFGYEPLAFLMCWTDVAKLMLMVASLARIVAEYLILLVPTRPPSWLLPLEHHSDVISISFIPFVIVLTLGFIALVFRRHVSPAVIIATTSLAILSVLGMHIYAVTANTGAPSDYSYHALREAPFIISIMLFSYLGFERVVQRSVRPADSTPLDINVGVYGTIGLTAALQLLKCFASLSWNLMPDIDRMTPEAFLPLVRLYSVQFKYYVGICAPLIMLYSMWLILVDLMDLVSEAFDEFSLCPKKLETSSSKVLFVYSFLLVLITSFAAFTFSCQYLLGFLLTMVLISFIIYAVTFCHASLGKVRLGFPLSVGLALYAIIYFDAFNYMLATNDADFFLFSLAFTEAFNFLTAAVLIIPVILLLAFCAEAGHKEGSSLVLLFLGKAVILLFSILLSSFCVTSLSIVNFVVWFAWLLLCLIPYLLINEERLRSKPSSATTAATAVVASATTAVENLVENA